MPIKCKNKPRYRYRKISKGKQRLAFCNGDVVEITMYRNGKKVKTKKIRVK